MFSTVSQWVTSLQDITADLIHQFDIDISKEGLHKRFTSSGVKFMKSLVKEQLSGQFNNLKQDSLSTHFPSIIIKDSSKFSLPTTYGEYYPGFGNFSKKNGVMNLQYEYDLINGDWKDIRLTNIKTNDQKDSNQTIDSIIPGSLYLRDLGYVTITYLKGIEENDAFFLNRLPPQADLYTLEQETLDWESIHKKFSKTGINTLDTEVLIYKNEKFPCRLIIEKLPEQEYKNRLKKAENTAKSRGVGISKMHKIRCRYNAFITNVNREILPVEKIRKTYYLRWQIELVFKTWKSFFQIDKVKKVKKERLECQLLAKLLWIIINWRLFQTCNQYLHKKTPGKGVSVLKFFKRCLTFSHSLRQVVLKQLPLLLWVEKTFLPLIENTLCEQRTNKLTHYQLMYNINNSLS